MTENPAQNLIDFRDRFYHCLESRADAQFELCDAILCSEGPVDTLVGLSQVPEHRRGYGALYDAVNHGTLTEKQLRGALLAAPLPRDASGRIVLAVDISNWLRPDAPTSPERLFCHTYARSSGAKQMIPGWPYSFIAPVCEGPHPVGHGPGGQPGAFATCHLQPPSRRMDRPDRRTPVHPL